MERTILLLGEPELLASAIHPSFACPFSPFSFRRSEAAAYGTNGSRRMDEPASRVVPFPAVAVKYWNRARQPLVRAGIAPVLWRAHPAPLHWIVTQDAAAAQQT